MKNQDKYNIVLLTFVNMFLLSFKKNKIHDNALIAKMRDKKKGPR